MRSLSDTTDEDVPSLPQKFGVREADEDTPSLPQKFGVREADEDTPSLPQKFDHPTSPRNLGWSSSIDKYAGAGFLLPAGLVDTPDVEKELPFWFILTCKIVCVVLLIAKAILYTFCLIMYIRFERPLYVGGSDESVTQWLLTVLWSLENVIMYGCAVQFVLYNFVTKRLHVVFGICSSGSSMVAGWLGSVWYLLNSSMAIADRVGFALYWVLVAIVGSLVLITGYRRRPKQATIFDTLAFSSHIVWSIRMYCLNISTLLYAGFVYCCVTSVAWNAFSFLFYIAPLLLVEISLVGVRWYLKSL
jgi:hypothetical protein